ncbi:MAG: cytochrome c biogenesis protein CcdA [Candidatus Promineifilaceae bacterium]|nr:cytochrome c biogenesis protein CcdA [Candidatus Promineifilaceae bacterium]
MSEYLQAFILGNAAILTNVCILPLYPGLMAYMAANARSEQAQRAMKWMGLLVLLGVLTMMILVGGLLFALQQSFGAILPILLPTIYGVVILLGLLMLSGRNPFNRLQTVQTPLLRNPFIGAYVYGLLLGPMTLPCTGPIILSAFLLGSNSTAELADGLLYFFFFGLGFGWPLVLLPFLVTSLQKRLIRWTTTNYKLLTRASGILLILIGLAGIYVELLPQIS